MDPTRPTLYFNGGCPLCRREIAFYRRQRGADAVCWVDASQCAPGALGPGLDRSDALARLHLRQPDGRLVSGARAFAALWQALPATRWLGRLFDGDRRLRALELAYRGFLRLRRGWRRP